MCLCLSGCSCRTQKNNSEGWMRNLKFTHREGCLWYFSLFSLHFRAPPPPPPLFSFFSFHPFFLSLFVPSPPPPPRLGGLSVYFLFPFLSPPPPFPLVVRDAADWWVSHRRRGLSPKQSPAARLCVCSFFSLLLPSLRLPPFPPLHNVRLLGKCCR
jgi:hypothetical protein